MKMHNERIFNQSEYDVWQEEQRIKAAPQRVPAFIFGAGFSEEEQKVTTLTRYLELETWTPIEAALLVCGLMPVDDRHEIPPKGAMALDGRFAMPNEDSFYYAKQVLKLWNSKENPPSKVRPAAFVAWCKTKNIDTTWLSDVENVQNAPTPKMVAVSAVKDYSFTTLENAAYALAEEQWPDEGEASAEFALKQLGMDKGCFTAACAMRTLQELKYQKRIDLLMKDKCLPLYKYAPLSDSKLVPSPDGTWVKVDELKLKLSSDAVLRLEQDTQPAPTPKMEAGTVTTPAPAVQINKLRINTLDPAIDKAIQQAGCAKLAPVYLKLRELALAEESPFTGIIEADALCYTDDNGQPAKLTKNALGQRLKRR